MGNTLQASGVLCLSAKQRQIESGTVLLRAIPYLGYFDHFELIRWDPAMIGLENVGRGCDPTLVAAPAWACRLMEKVECLGESAWDIPLFSRAPFDLWQNLPSAPLGMRISDDFIKNGGFINIWEDESRYHLLWGQLQPASAISALCFVWLQRVLAGGRAWRRRELGILPRNFREMLPLGYLCLEKSGRVLHSHDLGMELPILQSAEGRMFNIGRWIMGDERLRPESRAKNDMERVFENITAVIFPDMQISFVPRRQNQRDREYFFLLSKEIPSNGFLWRLSSSASPACLGLYPSGFGAKIDNYQKIINSWIIRCIPEITEAKLTEISLCLREAMINADKHGCREIAGGRILLQMGCEESPRCLRVQVCDPGKGHQYDSCSTESRHDHAEGKHLGLMLIHGLANHVRFNRGGAIIEFDFYL